MEKFYKKGVTINTHADGHNSYEAWAEYIDKDSNLFRETVVKSSINVYYGYNATKFYVFGKYPYLFDTEKEAVSALNECVARKNETIDAAKKHAIVRTQIKEIE